MAPKDVHILILERVNVLGHTVRGIKVADGIKVIHQPNLKMDGLPGVGPM